MSVRSVSDAEVAAHFIKATIAVLKTMSGIEATAGNPFVKNEATAQGDVSALVTVTGDKQGSIAVSFSRSCAKALVKGMLGDAIQDLLQDTHDAVGEVTNMISGHARASLADQGLMLQGSTPTVIIGENHMLTHPSGVKIMAIPFQTSSGDFAVEFCFS